MAIVIKGHDKMCLFCGNRKKQKWEDNESYYECDCSDAKKNRNISKVIDNLEQSRPKIKYEVIQQTILVEKNK